MLNTNFYFCFHPHIAEVKRLYQEVFELNKLKQELEESQKSLVKAPAASYDAAIHADYLSATEGPVLEELSSTVLEITGSNHQSIKWLGNGFRLTVPAGAVPEGTTISLAVRASWLKASSCQTIVS